MKDADTILRELVELKRLKDRIDAAGSWERDESRAHMDRVDEYERRKPAVAGPVERGVRPALADALDAWWDAAYAEGREGMTHDTEGGAAQKALQDIWAAHSAQLAAAVAAERERIARHFDERDKGVGGFYDAHEPAEIIRALGPAPHNTEQEQSITTPPPFELPPTDYVLAHPGSQYEAEYTTAEDAYSRYAMETAIAERDAWWAAQTEALRAAAQAVVERWETPLWKDAPHTGEFIARLRDALAARTKEQAP